MKIWLRCVARRGFCLLQETLCFLEKACRKDVDIGH